jgi:aryl-alcohol dehydrogenase-like predicted oxidoreductase
VALKELMEEKKVPREDLVVTTKIFLGATVNYFPNSSFCSRKHIIEGLRNSLKRL